MLMMGEGPTMGASLSLSYVPGGIHQHLLRIQKNLWIKSLSTYKESQLQWVMLHIIDISITQNTDHSFTMLPGLHYYDKIMIVIIDSVCKPHHNALRPLSPIRRGLKHASVTASDGSTVRVSEGRPGEETPNASPPGSMPDHDSTWWGVLYVSFYRYIYIYRFSLFFSLLHRSMFSFSEYMANLEIRLNINRKH